MQRRSQYLGSKRRDFRCIALHTAALPLCIFSACINPQQQPYASLHQRGLLIGGKSRVGILPQLGQHLIGSGLRQHFIQCVDIIGRRRHVLHQARQRVLPQRIAQQPLLTKRFGHARFAGQHQPGQKRQPLAVAGGRAPSARRGALPGGAACGCAGAESFDATAHGGGARFVFVFQRFCFGIRPRSFAAHLRKTEPAFILHAAGSGMADFIGQLARPKRA